MANSGSTAQANQGRPWSPYLAGGLTGLAITMALLISETTFGATPFYSYISRAVELLILGHPLNVVDSLGRQLLQPRWIHMFAVGIPIGALIASVVFRDFKWQAVPPLWRERFGGSALKRGSWAFVGGAIAMIGVRQAMGCPSGLGLSGMIALSVSGFLGFGMFFLGGTLLANLIYSRRGSGTGGGK